MAKAKSIEAVISDVVETAVEEAVAEATKVEVKEDFGTFVYREISHKNGVSISAVMISGGGCLVRTSVGNEIHTVFIPRGRIIDKGDGNLAIEAV